MRLSVCYMVKDEILSLPESIRNTLPYVDEICIVDTGSKDGTLGYLSDVELSEKKIKVQMYSWDDNFSAARNKSLEMATGDWILVLDADEWIDKAHYKKIRKLMTQKPESYLFTIMHFMQDPHWVVNPKVIYGQAIRLFRNNGYKYEGIVHNKLTIDNPANVDTLGVYNFEYKGRHKVKDKAVQNKRLMDKKIKAEGWTQRNCIHYADIYRQVWNWHKDDPIVAKNAIKYLNKSLEIKHNFKMVEVRNSLLKEVEHVESQRKSA